MQLLLVGISHRTAPVELRERVDFSARGVAEALRALATRGCDARSGDRVHLQPLRRSTRRATMRAATRADLERFIGEFNEVSAGDITPHVYELGDLEAARHLFRVAAGLDSLVVGEPQILGQVKDAHAAAAERADRRAGAQPRCSIPRSPSANASGPKPGSARAPVSVSFAAVALARKIFGELTGMSVVVIGAGRNGQAHRDPHEGAGRAARDDRQPHHGARGADRGRDRRRIGGALGGHRRRRRGERHRHHGHRRGDADPDQGAASRSVMRPRRNRPLFIIDIADAARRRSGGRRDRAGLSLQHRRSAGDRAREPGAPRQRSEPGRSHRHRRSQKFAAWLRSRGAIPTVVALRQRFEAIRRAELDRLDFKLSDPAA